MAKGQAKTEVAKVILEAFGDKAFLYNDGKEVRVNWIEDGNPVQIKLALTTSKVAVEKDGDIALPSAPVKAKAEMLDFSDEASAPVAPAEPSVEEKQRIADLLKAIGL